MTLPRIAILVCAVAALGAGACSPSDPPAAPPIGGGVGTSPAGQPGEPSSPVTSPVPPLPPPVPPPPVNEPPAAPVDYRVSYDWGVPSSLVTVDHPVVVPVAAPPAPPLPYLVGVYVGRHPTFQRISFYFRGAFPSYNFRYVSQVTAEGTGAPVALSGNAFLRLGFTGAQAHDDHGSTVTQSPKNPIGFANLRSYAFAGDFEGHVTYGLGIQVAPGSDQVLRIRAGELKKTDGSGGFYYVVHYDVENG